MSPRAKKAHSVSWKEVMRVGTARTADNNSPARLPLSEKEYFTDPQPRREDRMTDNDNSMLLHK